MSNATVTSRATRISNAGSTWERSNREGPDDGLPADAADDPEARGDVLPAPGDRDADAGPELPPLHVRRPGPAVAAAPGGAERAGARARGPGCEPLLGPPP